jgi:hypothetical protein
MPRLHQARRGIAAVEFALTLPIWVTMLLASTDGCYYMMTNERTERIATTIANVVAQSTTVTNASLADVVVAGQQLMNPLPSFQNNGVVIITSVYEAPGQNPTICWQYTGGGGLSMSSKVGTPNGAANCAAGSPASLPNGLTMSSGDNVIITEVYYTFNPLFLNDAMLPSLALTQVFPSQQLYQVAMFMPRLGSLLTPPT